jgi:uncharacterized protein (DUF1684 family)
MKASDVSSLLDWKRRIFELYAEIRRANDPEEAWSRWRSVRDDLFKNHPQSPLPAADRETFTHLPMFDYDPRLRLETQVISQEPKRYDIGTSGEDPYSFTRFGRVEFELEGPQALELYWLEGYGGGIFLPFRDGTSGHATYGAGRYLYDTIKGADLGERDGALVLDFNFAYNPSCAYDPRWVCPLAPPPNRLSVSIEAGERYAQD